MSQMPDTYIKKILKLNALIQQALLIESELADLFENDGLSIDMFLLTDGDVPENQQTEALACILNGQGSANQIDHYVASIGRIYAMHKNKNG